MDTVAPPLGRQGYINHALKLDRLMSALFGDWLSELLLSSRGTHLGEGGALPVGHPLLPATVGWEDRRLGGCLSLAALQFVLPGRGLNSRSLLVAFADAF